MRIQHVITTLIAGIAAVFLGACGPGGTGEPQPVDHQTTVRALESNSKRLSKSFTRAVQFIEGSKLLDGGAASLQMSGDGSGCASGSDCTRTSEVQVETDTSSHRKDFVDGLKKHVFNERYIVSRTNTSITYQIPGESICTRETTETCTTSSDGTKDCSTTTESGSDYERCKKRANEMNYRIQVTSPSRGNLVLHLFVGSQNYNPLVVELFEDHVASAVSLGDIKKTAELYDRVHETDVAKELPSTFRGRLYSKFERLAREKVHFETTIKSGINIGGGDYSFQLAAAAKPVFGITADGANETITATVDFDTIEASFPAEHNEYQSESTSTEPAAKTFQHVLHLAGLNGRTKLTGSSEKLRLEKLGLGDSTSWLKIGGEKVVSVDLNPGAGRQFSATLEPVQNGSGLEASISPKFRLDLLLKFKRIADELQITSDWALDDEISVELSGGSPAKVLLSSGYMEVVEGVFRFGSTSAGVRHTAQAGQCVVEKETSSSGTSGDGSTTEPNHPIEYFTVAQCAN